MLGRFSKKGDIAVLVSAAIITVGLSIGIHDYLVARKIKGLEKDIRFASLGYGEEAIHGPRDNITFDDYIKALRTQQQNALQESYLLKHIMHPNHYSSQKLG